MITETPAELGAHEHLLHEVVLYAGDDEFMTVASQFIRDAVTVDEPILVMVSAAKINKLRAALADVEHAVTFVDMGHIGRNPAMIMSAWQAFADNHAGDLHPLRGMGEPIWVGRTAVEISECLIHEALLNIAFANDRRRWVKCLYDTSTLPPEVIADACSHHPYLHESGTRTANSTYRFAGDHPDQLNPPLTAPPDGAAALAFITIDVIQPLIDKVLGRAGFSASQRANLSEAGHELAINSILHGEGDASVVVWIDGHTAICELKNSGHHDAPCAGRQPPLAGSEQGSGLWRVNQLCDVVQIRTSAAGTTVRAHLKHAPAGPSGEHLVWNEFGDCWMVVAQAVGMISVQLQITPSDALIELRAEAYATGRTVGDISADVVNRTIRFPH